MSPEAFGKRETVLLVRSRVLTAESERIREAGTYIQDELALLQQLRSNLNKGENYIKDLVRKKLSTASRFTNRKECAIMPLLGRKGRKNDDNHVHDQQMQKTAAKTRL